MSDYTVRWLYTTQDRFLQSPVDPLGPLQATFMPNIEQLSCSRDVETGDVFEGKAMVARSTNVLHETGQWWWRSLRSPDRRTSLFIEWICKGVV